MGSMLSEGARVSGWGVAVLVTTAITSAVWAQEYTARDVQSNVDSCERTAASLQKGVAERDWGSVARGLDDYCTTHGYLEKWGVELSPLASSEQLFATAADSFLTALLQDVENRRRQDIARAKEAQQGTEMERILHGKPEYQLAVVVQRPEGLALYFNVEQQIEEKISCYKRISVRSAKPAAFAARLEELRTTLKNPEQVRRERDTAEWVAWLAKARSKYAALWSAKQQAEEAARPLFSAGMAALAAQNYAEAKQQLTQARTQLYQTYLPTLQEQEKVQPLGFLRNGLAYEIAEGLAQVALGQKDEGLLWAQFPILKAGRPWSAEEAEFLLIASKAKEPKPAKLPPGETDWGKVLIPAPRADAASSSPLEFNHKAVLLSMAASHAAGKGCERLNVQCANVGRAIDDYAGKVHIDRYVSVSEPVTKVTGNDLEFELHSNAYDCKETDRVDRINPFTGRVFYRTDCKYKGSYQVRVARPAGLKEVKKGDVVTFHAKIKKSTNRLVLLQNATFVQVERDDKPVWYFGVGP